MSISSQHHTFDIALAVEFGIERAILIHHLQHWVRFNRKRNKNLKEGKCWTYQSKADIAAHFPYLSYDSIRYHLDILVNGSKELNLDPILLAKNFNKSAMDKTLWYAFINEDKFGVSEDKVQKMFTKGENPQSMGENPQRSGENPRAIPDTNKEYTETDKEMSEVRKRPPTPHEAIELAHYLFEKIKFHFPKTKVPKFEDWAKELDKANRIDKRSWEELKEVIDFAMDDAFWCKNILSAEKLRAQYDKLYAQMTPIQNKGTIQKINKELAKDLLNYLISKGQGKRIQFFNEYLIIPEKNEKLLFSLNPDTFEELLCKYLGLKRKSND